MKWLIKLGVVTVAVAAAGLVLLIQSPALADNGTPPPATQSWLHGTSSSDCTAGDFKILNPVNNGGFYCLRFSTDKSTLTTLKPNSDGTCPQGFSTGYTYDSGFGALCAYFHSGTLTFDNVQQNANSVQPTSANTNPGNGTSKCGNTNVAVNVGCDQTSTDNPIYVYLRAIIQFLSGAIGLGVVLMLVLGGVQYITSAGNPNGIKAAKSRIANALIGLVLFILMFGILNYLIPGGVLK